ncbi:hypothetical protein D9756_006086 [Leucocoprinus leucothites]|uniref:F-box domain-containing protein n=1 Tax=Leucocoprinus leucothites TaxID=201217 RepID=A0A8H5D5W1_9AGAR|nr:hypothetical protein D9756_006086 [Leucoagaricus leucothites]
MYADMLTLDELPHDILVRVIQELSADQRVLYNVRLVSRKFNGVTTPFVFSNVLHCPAYYNRERCLTILSDVVERRTTVFTSTRHLSVSMGVMVGQAKEHYTKVWFDLWRAVLPTMTNLRSLQWDYAPLNSCPIEWVNSFIECLGKQNTLKDLSIHVALDRPPPEFSLQPLSGLGLFSVWWLVEQAPGASFISQLSGLLGRCPDLESFKFRAERIDITEIDPSVTLAQLLDGLSEPLYPLKLRQLSLKDVVAQPEDFRTHLRHFHHLEELTLDLEPRVLVPRHFAEICAMLQTEGIHLKRFFVEAVSYPDVSRYLASYSGLEELTMRSLDHKDDSVVIVEDFITSVHGHCLSLKLLDLEVNRISMWPQAIVSHLRLNAEQYVALRKLRIRVCITLDDVREMRAGHFLDLLEAATRLRALRCLECPFVLYKTGSYTTNWSRDDLLEPFRGGRSSQIYSFMDRVVERFKRDHQPDFDIVLSFV